MRRPSGLPRLLALLACTAVLTASPALWAKAKKKSSPSKATKNAPAAKKEPAKVAPPSPRPAAPAAPEPAAIPPREAVRRESHIEFDDRLVQGQRASGAIYLFQRGESKMESMVQVPESFRERTLAPAQRSQR